MRVGHAIFGPREATRQPTIGPTQRQQRRQDLRVHYVVHESFEAPAAFEAWRESRGHEATYSRVYAHEPLPRSMDDLDLLVVMGGPQSPSTSIEDCPHFDAAAERALIERCVRARRAVVGVCLGAQLIGEALGAPHERSPEKEIGKFPIMLTASGKANAKFAHFGDTLDVGHWHNDMPGLRATSKVIAYSQGCPRQIIEYDHLVYGFQCHLEFNREVIDLLISASERELSALRGHRFVQQPAALRANDYFAMNRALFGFLDRLMEEYSASRAAGASRAPR